MIHKVGQDLNSRPSKNFVRIYICCFHMKIQGHTRYPLQLALLNVRIVKIKHISQMISFWCYTDLMDWRGSRLLWTMIPMQERTFFAATTTATTTETTFWDKLFLWEKVLANLTFRASISARRKEVEKQDRYTILKTYQIFSVILQS